MKQVILGILGTAMVIYTVISCMAVYSISSRRNEMENCLATVLKQNMDAYYVRQIPRWEKKTDGGTASWEVVYEPERKYSDEQVAAFVKQDLVTQLRSDSKVTVSILACDMEKGILSAGITEQFFLPNGQEKVLRCSKTLVVE